MVVDLLRLSLLPLNHLARLDILDPSPRPRHHNLLHNLRIFPLPDNPPLLLLVLLHLLHHLFQLFFQPLILILNTIHKQLCLVKVITTGGLEETLDLELELVDLVVGEGDAFLDVLEVVVGVVVLGDEAGADVLLWFEFPLPHHTTLRPQPLLMRLPPHHIPLLRHLLRLLHHMIPLSHLPLLLPPIPSHRLQIYRLIPRRLRPNNSLNIDISSILQLGLYLPK